ncbi:glycerol kinase GlpK [Allorhodopirellula heiligendammensis]|uniref:Glycerol kinase n=1 Tax=Allorhodopirellula heiligendammensis TaxID=2714739 RepID=A0A5C6C5X9_9BACT|nr:glycerol kinase GlpK [Allorhodopirellula heiligendammensis]TWU18189.1 Glycerol kinase [Allorhodopirellula heiligendammensis]
MKYILALDQGTTSSRAILFDRAGTICGTEAKELTQHYPQSGWVEHDAVEIWNSQRDVARQVLQSNEISAAEIAAIGITNQRETVVLWDRETGQPLHNAIVWQDRRTADFCDQLRSDGRAEMISEKTGLVIDPYFSGTKLRWLLDNIPDARRRADRGELAFGTIDTWLLWNLSGGRTHVTDVSNAARTMMLNLLTLDWDDSLLNLLDIPRSVLPKVRPSSYQFAESTDDFLGQSIPIAGCAGDQHAALFGQNCTENAMAKCTYGTGCFVLMNIGREPIPSKCKLLTTIACTREERPQFALEGSIFIGGAVVQWLRDELHIADTTVAVAELASTVPDSGDCYLVPAFAGLGAPHWDPYARGTIVGISRGTTSAHLARAAIESIAFQVADVLDAMNADTGIAVKELRVDGGASANDFLMQFQADILQVPVERPRVIETTALGAAFLAGLAVGFWKNLDEVETIRQSERVFEPSMPSAEVAKRRARWQQAVQRSMGWQES